VSQLGGLLRVESEPAQGTRLRVDLPLPNASDDSRELSS
jgi:chemotaxis protein histidine kinase CheA